jgi:hypothetical protein
MEGLSVVAEVVDRFEADLLAAALRAEAIPVSFNEDSRRSMLGGGLLGPGTHGADVMIEVLVPTHRLEEAHEVLRVGRLGEDSLPPEFRDDVWAEGVSVNSRRRRRARRMIVLVPLYGMAAAVVLVAVLGLVLSR